MQTTPGGLIHTLHSSETSEGGEQKKLFDYLKINE